MFGIEHSRAEALVAILNQAFGACRAQLGTDLAHTLPQADGLVNSTPIGMTARHAGAA